MKNSKNYFNLIFTSFCPSPHLPQKHRNPRLKVRNVRCKSRDCSSRQPEKVQLFYHELFSILFLTIFRKLCIICQSLACQKYHVTRKQSTWYTVQCGNLVNFLLYYVFSYLMMLLTISLPMVNLDPIIMLITHIIL